MLKTSKYLWLKKVAHWSFKLNKRWLFPGSNKILPGHQVNYITVFWQTRTSSPRICEYSMSSSCSVSMWSLVKAMGTSRRFFFPRWHKPFMTSSVCGPNHAIGPTYTRHTSSSHSQRRCSYSTSPPGVSVDQLIYSSDKIHFCYHSPVRYSAFILTDSDILQTINCLF